MLYAERDQEDYTGQNDQDIFPLNLWRFVVSPHVITFSDAHSSLRSVRTDTLTVFPCVGQYVI
ncbi:MAG: hypothetical protein DME69_04245 [Verrucomicrobia bacterium]|nr:MAG: hypothetical protein DME87_08620 [Verrucomicrobiota bacterium]PYJ79543.1 MAG: hypothetical protein DME69_04245 [Verrucomicrobiota bacterium]